MLMALNRTGSAQLFTYDLTQSNTRIDGLQRATVMLMALNRTGSAQLFTYDLTHLGILIHFTLYHARAAREARGGQSGRT